MLPAKREILCVDGNEETCRVLTLMLGRVQFDAATAHNVSQAVSLATSGNFDLYIIESSFPDGSGIELCNRLRSLSPAVPLIFYTADPHEPSVSEAKAAGAAARLSKDWDLDKLVGTIRSLISPKTKRL